MLNEKMRVAWSNCCFWVKYPGTIGLTWSFHRLRLWLQCKSRIIVWKWHFNIWIFISIECNTFRSFCVFALIYNVEILKFALNLISIAKVICRILKKPKFLYYQNCTSNLGQAQGFVRKWKLASCSLPVAGGFRSLAREQY